jgi:cytochrome P450
VCACPLEEYIVESIDVNGPHVSVVPDILQSRSQADISKVPPGVIASTPAYGRDRLASVFVEPEKWHPDRWLEATDNMHPNWTPFGHGARGYPGSNLAMTELKDMIRTILRLYRVEPPEEQKPKALDLGDVFVSGERSGICWLSFSDVG